MDVGEKLDNVSSTPILRHIAWGACHQDNWHAREEVRKGALGLLSVLLSVKDMVLDSHHSKGQALFLDDCAGYFNHMAPVSDADVHSAQGEHGA